LWLAALAAAPASITVRQQQKWLQQVQGWAAGERGCRS
jgi:hypothetical protein